MEETHTPTDRRSQPRYAVDADATLVVVNQGATIRGRILEISMDGCRMSAEKRQSFGLPAGIEIISKINGIGFRLGGTLQWFDNQQTAGIQFAPMAPRRRDALLDLLAELDAEEQARIAKEAAKAADEEAAAREATEKSEDGQKKEGETRRNAIPVEEKGRPSSAPGPPPAKQVSSVPARPWAPRPPAAVAGPPAAPKPSPMADSPAKPPVSISRPTVKVADPPVVTRDALDAATPSSPAADRISRPAPIPKRERRAQARHSVDTRAIIFLIDVRSQICGRILDLSMGGCRICTDERFPVGIYRRVETEFQLDGLPFRLLGVVQSLHDKFNVGIRFLDMSARKRDQLQLLTDEIEEVRANLAANPDPRGDGSASDATELAAG